MRQRTTIAKFAAASMVATLLTLALTATAAQAHYTYVYNGADLMSVSSDHQRTSVCDRTSDGKWAMGWVRTSAGQELGFSSPTHTCWTADPGAALIRSFRLCKYQKVSCTAWRNA
ncbi:MAG TPA: hypothetical protein VF062_09455 [Candidatus Limnocylindrales bacterium]